MLYHLFGSCNTLHADFIILVLPLIQCYNCHCHCHFLSLFQYHWHCHLSILITIFSLSLHHHLTFEYIWLQVCHLCCCHCHCHCHTLVNRLTVHLETRLNRKRRTIMKMKRDARWSKETSNSYLHRTHSNHPSRAMTYL